MTLSIFVATQSSDIPDGATPFISVDGSVPGAALTWDHHVTGEAINLDAMPAHIDTTGFRGLATPLADTDALASMVAVLFGGAAHLPHEAQAVLRSASHWCDHVRPHPSEDDDTNRIGERVHHHVAQALASVPLDERGAVLAEQVRRFEQHIRRGTALPQADPPAATHLREEDRLREHGAIAVFDLRGRGRVDPAVAYAETRCPVGLFVRDHPGGGTAYTVGLHPQADPSIGDLRQPLALLARAEHAHGPPARRPEPVPGAETWGGRATVFGSPWNYGSRLTVDEVLHWIRTGLALADG